MESTFSNNLMLIHFIDFSFFVLFLLFCKNSPCKRINDLPNYPLPFLAFTFLFPIWNATSCFCTVKTELKTKCLPLSHLLVGKPQSITLHVKLEMGIAKHSKLQNMLKYHVIEITVKDKLLFLRLPLKMTIEPWWLF